MIRAFVGSGGKTGTILALAQTLRAQGKRVLICTTTHMAKTDEMLLDAGAEAILERMYSRGIAMAGSSCGEKLGPLPPEIFAQLAAHADEVLAEADGSKQLPIKYPAVYEPVIPEGTAQIAVVTGVGAMGRTLRTCCHRPQLAAACLNVPEDAPVTAEHVFTLAREGYLLPLRRTYPQAETLLLPNHCHTLYARAAGRMMAAGLSPEALGPAWTDETEDDGRAGVLCLTPACGEQPGKRLWLPGGEGGLRRVTRMMMKDGTERLMIPLKAGILQNDVLQPLEEGEEVVFA